jgi:hypothetical protein
VNSRFFAPTLLVSAIACGGTIDEAVSDNPASSVDPVVGASDAADSVPHADAAGGSPDASGEAPDASYDGFFTCVLNPEVGVACTTTASLCAGFDPCAEQAWVCAIGQWRLETSAPCVDSGVP